MKLARFLLWLNCGLFCLFGLGFMFAPAYLAMLLTDASPTSTSALIDMRATYGGMALGLGLLLGLAARSQYLRLGLQGLLAVMLALSLGRMTGIAVDGEPNLFMFVLLGAELLMGLLSGIALCQVSRQ